MTDSKRIKLESCKISAAVHDLKPSGIRRFFDIVSTMKDIISLGIGEPDFMTPWNIRESAIYSLERGQTMYTSNKGMQSLREEIALYYKNHYNLDYDPESEILITVGVSEALDLALRAIINPGDEIILPNPHYVAYPACAILAGGIPSYIPLFESNNFKIDPGDLKEKITSNTKALLFGYPANPTGSIMSYKELTDIAEIVKQKDILVISDEIYERLVYETNPICFAGVPGMRDSTVVLGGFSKTYAMTGWRVGYALARHEIIDAMTKIHQYTMLCAPIMAQNAALCALQEGENDVNVMVAEYNYRRKFMYKKLNEIGLPCSEPLGAFYCFPSVKNTGMSSEEFATKLLYEEKVAVVPGDAFGEYGEGYIRCCYATSLNEIEEAIGRIRNFINKHSK
jgi:aminotransferase